MAEEGYKRKLTAVFSADVVGYSRLMGEDEATTVKTLETYKDIMAALIKQHRGRVVDSPGDNLLAEFASVVDAVQCGVAVQKELQAHNADLPENRRMRFRIGINLGDVIEEGGRVYGDGVNIAARLESLADPGGICVSKTAFDHIESKLPLGYQFLGEQKVKNISKPLGAYKVLMEPRVTRADGKGGAKEGQTWRYKPVFAGAIAVLIVILGVGAWNLYWRASKIRPASQEKMAFPLPDKPSIAVLPFVNMSEDPKQEYFSDGLTEDLITDLSQISGLFVIARNSTFAYKGKSVNARQVAEELGVRYVLEGSVRKADKQVRINTQLIDATTGGHLWAKRYDGDLDDVFSLQDNITQKIVAALAVKLSTGEKEQVARKGTDNIVAYDAFLKGGEYYRRWTPEDFLKAIPYFQKAIELDPNYGRAYAALASIYFESWLRMWDWPRILGLSMIACFDETEKYLQKAMENPTPLAHQVTSKKLVHLLYYEEGVAEARRAIALDPNDADGYVAMADALIYSGNFEEAVDFVKKAMRLDPNNPATYLYTLGLAHFGMEQFQQASSFFERAFKLNPEMGSLQRAYLAVAYLYLGQAEKARTELDKSKIETMEMYNMWVGIREVYKKPRDRERLLDGLRKVGIPEN
jgi:adenylate cyclase